MMRKNRMRMAPFLHTQLVTIFGDVMRIVGGYLAGMGTPTFLSSNGRSGQASDALPGYYPGHYHRTISLGAWMGVLAAGSMCWACILSSI